MPKPHGGRLINRVITGEKDKEEEARGLPQIVLTRELAKEVQNIAHGVFSPLEGFLTKKDYVSVLNKGRLSTDIPWTIPILLDISPERGQGYGQDKGAWLYRLNPCRTIEPISKANASPEYNDLPLITEERLYRLQH